MAKRSGGLGSLTMVELQRELRRREKMASRELMKLHRKREGLVASLSEIDQKISSLGGRVAGRVGGRKRPRNENNLADALAGVLTDQTLSVTDVAGAVQKAGYVTTSPNFRTIVNQTLIKDRRFKRVGRGQYTVRA